MHRYKAYFHWFKWVFVLVILSFIALFILALKGMREKSQREFYATSNNKLATEIYYNVFLTPQNFVGSLAKMDQIVCQVNHTPTPAEYERGAVAIETARRLTNASIVYIMDTLGDVVISSEFVGSDGKLSSLKGNNYRFRPYFSSALKGKDYVYPAIGITTGERGFYCSSPIYDEAAKVTGVAVIKMGFGNIEEIFNVDTNYFLLISPENVVFATNYRNWLFTTTKPYIVTDSSLQYNKTSIRVLPVNLNQDKLVIEKTKYLVIKNLLGSSGWQLVQLTPINQTFPINKYILTILTIFLVSVMILLTIIIILVINIRLRQKAQKALKINEEDLETTLYSIADAVIATDTNGLITRMNPVAQLLTGINIQDAKGIHINQILHLENTETKEPIYIPIDGIIEDKKQHNLGNNIQLISKQGARIQVTENTTPIISDKKITGVVIVIRDVTNEYLLKNKIQESEISLRKIIDHIEHYIFVTDINGNYLLTNSYFAQQLNTTVERLEKQNVLHHHILKGEQLDKSYAQSRQVIEQGVAINDFEVVFYNLKKEYRHVTSSKIPIIYNGIPAALTVAIDITEIKRFQMELEDHLLQLSRAKEQAEESNRLKTAFLQNLSHQIRTPLNSIVGFIDLMASNNPTDDEKSHYNELVKEGSQNLLNTIQNIIDISKLETKQVEVNKSQFSINKLLDEVVENFSSRSNSLLDLILEKGLVNDEDQLVTDREKLYSCISRLISNSFKYTSRGSITIGYAIAGSRIDFWIKDTGKGIPGELNNQLFELFQNANLPTTFQTHGLGLGLAIVKQYVELLNGHIWFETAANKGTSFYMSFPYQKMLLI